MPTRSQNFESNGPEGRVRGNAMQVYEKYLQLARDAHSAGDRVLAESFQQYAEHYYRIINDSTDPNNRPQPPREQRDQRSEELYDEDEEQDGEEEGREPVELRHPERRDHSERRDRPERQHRPERQDRVESQDRAERQDRDESAPARFDDRRQQARAGDPRYSEVRRDKSPVAAPEPAVVSQPAPQQTAPPDPAPQPVVDQDVVEAPPVRRGRRPAARSAPKAEAGEEDAGLLKMLGQPQRRANGGTHGEEVAGTVAEAPEAAAGSEEEAPKPRRRRRTTKEASEAGGADTKVDA